MKKVLQYGLLMLIAAVLCIGVYSYIKADDEPTKDDDLITEEVEVLSLNIMTNLTESEVQEAFGLPNGGITIQFEAGMTWKEWIDSDYNTFPLCTEGGEVHTSTNYQGQWLRLVYETSDNAVDYNDLIDINSSYSLV